MPTDPTVLVTRFLALAAGGETEAALALLDDDVVYTNVGLPTVRGRNRTARVLSPLDRPGNGFGVVIHHIAAAGPVVLTERTDELRLGRWVSQFWVCGRFEVHDGLITVWRDYFDFLDVTRGMVRGLAGLAVPGLVRPLPAPSVPRPGDSRPAPGNLSPGPAVAERWAD